VYQSGPLDERFSGVHHVEVCSLDRWRRTASCRLP
jgi:hypothetical protein